VLWALVMVETKCCNSLSRFVRCANSLSRFVRCAMCTVHQCLVMALRVATGRRTSPAKSLDGMGRHASRLSGRTISNPAVIAHLIPPKASFAKSAPTITAAYTWALISPYLSQADKNWLRGGGICTILLTRSFTYDHARQAALVRLA